MRQTEDKLERLVHLLVDRHGTNASLGSILARCSFLSLRREGTPVTVASISERSQISRQNVSRWVQQWIDRGTVRITPDPSDDRRKLLTLTDPEGSDAFVRELRQLLLS